MKIEDVKIGMRVVPFQKTVYTKRLEDSGVWEDALSKNQEFLYVIDWDEELQCFVLDYDNYNNGANGDFFNAEDFEVYEEGIIRNKQIKNNYEIAKIELTKEEMNVVRNGLLNLISLRCSHPEILVMTPSAEQWYKNVRDKFELEYERNFQSR